MAAAKSADMVRLLLAAGADVEITDDLGGTPLMNAARADVVESARQSHQQQQIKHPEFLIQMRLLEECIEP